MLLIPNSASKALCTRLLPFQIPSASSCLANSLPGFSFITEQRREQEEKLLGLSGFTELCVSHFSTSIQAAQRSLSGSGTGTTVGGSSPPCCSNKRGPFIERKEVLMHTHIHIYRSQTFRLPHQSWMLKKDEMRGNAI